MEEIYLEYIEKCCEVLIRLRRKDPFIDPRVSEQERNKSIEKRDLIIFPYYNKYIYLTNSMGYIQYSFN